MGPRLMTTSFCKVSHCRFPEGHVTKGHRCGYCGRFGHRKMECAGSDSVDVDPDFEDLPEQLQCSVRNCWWKEFHTTAGHSCNRCEFRGCIRCGRDRLQRGSFRARSDPLVRVTFRMCRKEDVLQTRTFVQGYCPVCFESDASNLVVLECGHAYSCGRCHAYYSMNPRSGRTTRRAGRTS